MSHGHSQCLVDGKVPVFVFPASLTFYADDQTSQKQVLTLYNPYDFALRFKVLSTAPRKYSATDAEGNIKPRCCIDIVIRHNAIMPCNYGVMDKFRIQMQEHGQRHVIGKKDVTATLLPTKPDANVGASGGGIGDGEHFEQLVAPTATYTRAQQYSIGTLQRPAGGDGSEGPNMFLVVAFIVCIVALLLPTEGQAEQSTLPSYLHLSFTQKLISAYALGLMTMVIMKT